MKQKRKLVNLLVGIVFVIIVLAIDTTSVTADTGFIPFIPVSGSSSSGTGTGQFSQPYHTAVDSSGNVYVTDTGNCRVQKFDANGNYITQWGSNGTGNGQFSSPMGITVDRDGNILVVDYINDPHIQKFDPNGNFLARWGSQGYTDGLFDRPDGIAVDSSGNIYVTDNVRKYIQKFDSNGNFLAKFSGPGNADNQLAYPNGIAIDSSGNIYVVDNDNNSIKKFNSEGAFQFKWGSGGTGDGQFIMPNGIATDSSDNIYVTDGGNHRIQKFDSNGHFLAKWGSNGSDIGQFKYPKGIMVDSDNNVFVADTGNNRIMVLAPALEATSTIKGQTITSLGRPSLKLDYVTAGALTLTGEQASDTTDVAPYATLFDTGSADANVKVVKYAAGSDTGSFDTDTAYAGEAVANNDFFIVGLTAAEGTKVVYYRINVTVPPATLTSFAFDGLIPAVTGVVDSTAKTIKLLAPCGTDVTKLTPTIIYTGKSVLPASGTEQDFTNPVKYTFVDFYGKEQDYYVTVCTEFGGGDGSQENPYQITKLEHLNNMRNHLDKHFILMNDLNFSLNTDYMDTTNKTTWTSGAGWTPVGTDLDRFTGSFDGGGHTISGLMIYSPDKCLGLFGYIASGAEVKDILLERVSVRSSTGGLYIGGLAGASDGSVTGCSVSGSVTGYSYVGGLIGSVTGTVRDSCSAAVVNGINAKGSPYKYGIKGGGLVGLLSGTSAEITGSYSSGAIDKFNFAGGLVGNVINSEIRNCYSTANVSNGINDIGGLVGVADAATISNCYALGSLGLYSYPMSDSCQGGLVGYMLNAATVEYCYSAGSVTGIHPGGLIGNLDSTGNTISDSFYDSVTSGCSDTGNGEPKTPAEMRTAGTFTNWDFSTMWDIVDTEANCSYPYLHIATQSPVPGYGEKVPISEEPENAAVIVGENTSFNITATGEGLVYQWQVDTGSGFTDIPDDSVHSGETTATLSLTGITVEMNGNKYRVIVSGTGVYPKTSDIAELTVKLNTPVIKSVNAGDKHAVITWDSVADATGYIVFSSTTSGSYGAAMETVSGSVYSCDATGLTNDTTYYFAVKATCGEVESDYSSQMSATPNAPKPEPIAPYITGQPESMTVIVGQTASFNVEVGGDEPLAYQWKKDSSDVSDGENISGAAAATLTIEKAQASDAGSYSCYVSNTAGNVSSNAAILAVYPPGSFILTADPGDRHVDLSWSTVTDAVYYDIYTDDSYTATVTGDVYYESINLINGNTYSFEVKATDGDKAVIAASGHVNATPRTVPGAPEDITAEAGNRQVIVSFTAPSDNGESSITGYMVTAYPGGITASGGASPITVTGLTNGTEYTFTVKAFNSAGYGSNSSASAAVTPSEPSADNSLTSVLGQAIAAGTEAGTSEAPKTASISVANAVAVVASADIVKHDAGAIVTFYGTDSSFTTPVSGSINLTADGATDIYIKVVAANSAIMYYRVTINRAALPVYTVTYKNNYNDTDATDYTTQTVYEGGKTRVPAQPMRSGYTFGGWYTEAACSTAWNFKNNPVMNNMILYAKWVTVPIPTYTVMYFGNGATSGSVPVDNNAYNSGTLVKIKANTGSLAKAGYAFKGWNSLGTTYTAGQTFTLTGNVNLTAIWAAVPATYTVTYNNNFTGGGIYTSQTNIVSGSTLTAPSEPSRSGNLFIGWYKDTACVNPWNFNTDTINADMSLYAKWAANTYTVRGTVLDDEAVPTAVSGAAVKVIKGNIQFGDTATTNNEGSFTITGVPDGTYNLIVTKDNQEVTVCITVSGGNYTYTGSITLPKGNKNSKLDVIGSETPNVVVDNLNNVFSDPNVFNSSDENTVLDGGTVEIRLTVQQNDNSTDKARVEAAMSSDGYTSGTVLDVDMTKTSTTSNGASEESAITAVSSLVKLIIPLPAELQGKASYVIYRAHDYGSGVVVDAITTTANGGEYIEISSDKTQITAYLKYFSTYAIAYVESTEPERTSHTKSSNTQRYVIFSTAGTGGSISPSGNESVAKGKSITYNITANKGYYISNVLVDGKSVGALASYTFSNIVSAHTIKAEFAEVTVLPYFVDDKGSDVFIGFASSVNGTMKYIAPVGKTVLFRANPKSFTDITGHWAKNYIDFVTEREIFTGIGGNTFSPDTGMTRAMFASTIGRLYERSYGQIAATVTGNKFMDVDYDAYYGDYVDWAAENSVITGVGGGMFEPDREITREEMAVILYRFAGFLDIPAAESGATQQNYSDASIISTWAAEAARYCRQIGIISGRDGGNFVPQDTATRAEVAVILQRFINKAIK